ncbi:lipoate--protein ligase family protein [Salinigranum salinum]|uniref:lipoate--protein ligase family protein n=1 Tax=Salinigranum salinum TaxID=1364937 RepID=UPI001260986C|nr:biotin/lipoate A/B protein ligase family protein [Salinigranum salinum]
MTTDVDPADRTWRLIREESRPGPMQMALDEVAAETAAAGGPRTVRLYRWEPSCLSLGYHQDPDTVDWEWCATEGVDVTRRPTGGGGIYHDSVGDVSYSITAPRDELPGDLMDCYHALLEPVLDGFSRLGVPVDFVEREVPALYEPACYLRALNPAHDLVVPDAADGPGRKVSGNAQYRQRDAVVQHGSITYSVVADRHLASFVDPGVTPESFGSRVTGVDEHTDAPRETVVTAFEDALASWCDADDGAWTDEELVRAHERATEKYAADEWVRRRSRAR